MEGCPCNKQWYAERHCNCTINCERRKKMPEKEFNDKSYRANMRFLIEQSTTILCINCGSIYTIKSNEDMIGLVCDRCGNIDFKKQN